MSANSIQFRRLCAYSFTYFATHPFRKNIRQCLPSTLLSINVGSVFLKTQANYSRINNHYHTSRIIREKISHTIVFLRPTFILRRLYLQRVPNVEFKTAKNFDHYYEYHTHNKKQWWSTRFKCPLTNEVVRIQIYM